MKVVFEKKALVPLLAVLLWAFGGAKVVRYVCRSAATTVQRNSPSLLRLHATSPATLESFTELAYAIREDMDAAVYRYTRSRDDRTCTWRVSRPGTGAFETVNWLKTSPHGRRRDLMIGMNWPIFNSIDSTPVESPYLRVRVWAPFRVLIAGFATVGS